ncbi:RNA polymerase sigma factor [Jiangella rhizosphaerae]|nr:sigma-70 family RNA polymerase sigma factor [Jiangella rhizosphaerae]
MSTHEDLHSMAAVREETDAFATLYRRLAPSTRDVALRIVANADDADEIVQQTFCAVLGAVRAGRGPRRNTDGYVYTVARNLAHDLCVDNRRVVPAGDLAPDGRLGLECSVEPTSHAAATLASLPRRWRAILWLIEVEGYSPAELAPAMALSPSAVSSLATRARRAFRKAYLRRAMRAVPGAGR